MRRKSALAYTEKRSSGPDQEKAARIGVLLQLHSEYTRSCFAIAIVGSIVNCLQANNNIYLDTAAVASYLPAQPLFGPDLGRDMIRNGVSDDLCRAAISIGNQLQLCVDLSQAYSRLGHRHAGSIDALADAWRRLANACYVFEYMIDCALDTDNAISLKPSRIVFGPLLKQIGGGQFPCVDDLGGICLPGWAERRANSRVAVSPISAEVEVLGERIPIEILDLSAGGIGFLGGSGLMVGDPIKFHIGALGAIPSTVVWNDNDRVGAAFNNPLHSMDIDYIRNHTAANE